MSICSMPMRTRLSSTDRMTPSYEKSKTGFTGGTPWIDCPGSGGAPARRSLPTLVASVNCARGLWRSTLPTRSSASPWPYSGAVSKNRMPCSHERSIAGRASASSTARYRPASGAVPRPSRVTIRSVRPRRTSSRGFKRSEFEDHGHAVAAGARVVVGDGHHRRHLRLPSDVDWVARQLGDGAVVVLALDVVKEVQAVAKDLVFRDAGSADRGQHLRPHSLVITLVTLHLALLQPRVDADPHRFPPASPPEATCPRTQRSPLAMCAVIAARASSGSPLAMAS